MTPAKRNSAAVTGLAAPGFERVADEFHRNFTDRGDVGASLCIYVDGRPVVDLVGGVADPSLGTPYDDDTLQLVFSTTKGITALVVLGLAQDGVLDLDKPIAEAWPAFAHQGKQDVTLRWVLGHRAGLPLIDARLAFDELLDTATIDAVLEEQRPLWSPNSDHGYHAITYGWIIDGAVRRITGASVAQHVRTRIAEPLGLDMWLALPPEVHGRVAPVIDTPTFTLSLKALRPLLNPKMLLAMPKLLRSLRDPESIANRSVYLNGALKPTDGSMVWNDPRFWGAGWPAASAVTNARSLARMYAATVTDVDGVRLLQPETADLCRTELSVGRGASSILPARFGHGFQLHHGYAQMLGEASFGHAGMGGSLGFADIDARVGFGYVMNQMQLSADRSNALVGALRRCLRT